MRKIYDIIHAVNWDYLLEMSCKFVVSCFRLVAIVFLSYIAIQTVYKVFSYIN